ncbi:hypothetical protein ABT218_21420 [Streptomyces sp. NPDC001455]|uniref:hypothetical protein n=1 Tax=Streptomyces sp. NPDC001455 TaxID=3154518 RepID=UPI00331D9FBF
MLARADRGEPGRVAAAPAATTGPAHAAVLYICAAPGTLIPGLAAQRAETEGHAYARDHGLTITETINDPYGPPDPCRRPGWRRVRELAETGAIDTVIARWPSSIAPDQASELRHHEIAWLRDHGTRLHYTWEPLATTDNDGTS